VAASTNPAVPTAPGRLPGLGHMLQLATRPIEFMGSLRSVGDLAWIYLGRQPVLSVNTPELIHRMVVTEGRKYDQGKYFDKIRDTFGNGLPVSNGEFHHRQRRLIQPAFHHQRITGYLDTMAESATAMAESWRPGEVVQLRRDALSLMLVLVARTLFSAGASEAVQAEVQRSWKTIVTGLARRTVQPDFLEKLPTPGNRRFESATARLREVVHDAVVAQRSGATGDGSNLLDMLIEARDEDTGEGMTDEQVMAEVFLILFAGTETAGFMTVWFFYELSRDPELERRVHDEIDGVLSGRPAGIADLPKLELTRRVLTECLRRYHPGWSFMRRANSTVELGGLEFPEGTETVFSINSLHRDPRIFPDPMKFDPDRWLPGGPEIPEGGFIPFLEGKRQCIGDSFAWAQMTCTVAAIASRWRLRPVDGHRMKEQPGVLMSPNETPMTVLER
jgi:cytochrome P450